MGVKTYQAYTMAEALAAAKRDLGSDAVILETRTFRRGGVLGVGRRTICELTATSADRAEISAEARRGARRPDPARTRRLAQAMAEAHERRRVVQPATSPAPAPMPAPAPIRATVPPIPRPAPREPRPAPREHNPAPPAPVARRFILTPAGAAATAVLDPPAAVAEPADLMRQELSAIRCLVSQVLERRPPPSSPAPDVPGRLFDMYLELIGQDLSKELAERIVTSVRNEVPSHRWDDTAAVREAVLDRLAELVPVADTDPLPAQANGRPRTIALIGPNGVGKTTTLAKLAANFKLREGRRVGLVTCDTYRIAAVDQLRTYANIIGLPLEVALTPDDMRRAVAGMRDLDVVLIDTAGRAPNDRGRLGELHRCLEAADPHEVHLVLSSTAGERVLLREAEAFADVGADRIVLTKLDEAVSFGVLINVMRSVGKTLSFITTGQEVPDHIEPGRPRRLAELILGADLKT